VTKAACLLLYSCIPLVGCDYSVFYAFCFKDIGKGLILDIALLHDEHMLMSALQSRKWQLIGMSYHSTLCGYPLPSLANNWTCGHTDIPQPQSATLDLHPVTYKLLLISHPAKGRRLRLCVYFSV